MHVTGDVTKHLYGKIRQKNYFCNYDILFQTSSFKRIVNMKVKYECFMTLQDVALLPLKAIFIPHKNPVTKDDLVVR